MNVFSGSLILQFSFFFYLKAGETLHSNESSLLDVNFCGGVVNYYFINNFALDSLLPHSIHSISFIQGVLSVMLYFLIY